MTETVIKT